MIVYVVLKDEGIGETEIICGVFPTANWAECKIEELSKQSEDRGFRADDYRIEPHDLTGAFYYAHTAEFFREKNEKALHEILSEEVGPEIVVHRRME